MSNFWGAYQYDVLTAEGSRIELQTRVAVGLSITNSHSFLYLFLAYSLLAISLELKFRQGSIALRL